MPKTKIAIACQGGGSHTAFTAGVLEHLLAEGIQERYDLVCLTGTSGGAICATAVWYGLAKAAQGSADPPAKVLIDFWRANAAQAPEEKVFAAVTGMLLRVAESGKVPMLPPNPYRDEQALEAMKPFFTRSEFLDFRELLEHHIDFAELQSLIRDNSPRLLLGAVNILTGQFKTFDSKVSGEICVEALLASAAVPTVFKAVAIGEDLYWDGLFSQNPPVAQLLSTDADRRPDEIWVILINPVAMDAEPTTTAEITDRRNALAGNISLYQEISFINVVNRWIEQGYFRPEKVGTIKPIKVRIIKMNKSLSDSLTYSTKLSRDADLMEKLLQDGRNQAVEFLHELREVA